MPFTDEQIEEALYKSAGVINAAARTLGINRVTLSKRIKSNPELKITLDSFRESNVDMAESIVFKRLRWANKLSEPNKEGEIPVPPSKDDVELSLKFLKMQGKDRGYTERQEVTGKDGQPLNPNHVDEIPDSVLMDIIKNADSATTRH